MKTRILFSFLMIASFLTVSNTAKAHCEIPCGIYGDSLRIEMIAEHITTIEKSMNQIMILSAEESVNYNQLVRWVSNKEQHANEIQQIVSQYFLHQRLPITDPANNHAYASYIKRLELLHHMLVYSMKAKQTTDLEYIQLMRETLQEFSDSYFHTHEH
ncbi:superoxide dismutase [Ni] [Roseimarinus sediminis]|uniref:superoxide dismutase [Ni] n=1 Tax=Roseimarinus sediminis TaxID=1610899 RepID=UPI003D19C479